MSKLLKQSKGLLKYGMAALLAAIPLYPKFPAIGIAGTYVSVRLEDFLMAAVALLALIAFLPEVKRLFAKKIERSVAILLGIGLVSLLSGILITQTVVPHIGLLHWMRRIEYFIPLFIGLLYFRDKKEDTLEFFLKILMIVLVVAFLYGLGQKYLSWPVIITQNEEYSKGVALRWIPGSHINSTFAGHYDLATFLVLLLPIFVSLFFVIKKTTSKVLLLVVIFSGLWLLANAVSRISIVSYLLGVTLALVLIKRIKAIPIVILISLVVFGFSSDLLARYMRIIEVTYQKILSTRQINLSPLTIYAQETLLPQKVVSSPTPTPPPVFEDRSTSIRLNVEWPRAIRALKKNTLLGTGYSSITLATDNDFLRLLGEVGLLGFLAFCLLFARIFQTFSKILPVTKYYQGVSLAFMGGFLGALPGVFLNAFFIDVFEASKFATIFWLLMGIAVAMARKKRNEDNI
ncbi:O-antigen ligase family protein [Candidatus Woesebacteria bacterium]|nr:O-antigen ligase family protein [Candidatus Woesebacteria bacterium]